MTLDRNSFMDGSSVSPKKVFQSGDVYKDFNAGIDLVSRRKTTVNPGILAQHTRGR